MHAVRRLAVCIPRCAWRTGQSIGRQRRMFSNASGEASSSANAENTAATQASSSVNAEATAVTQESAAQAQMAEAAKPPSPPQPTPEEIEERKRMIEGLQSKIERLQKEEEDEVERATSKFFATRTNKFFVALSAATTLIYFSPVIAGEIMFRIVPGKMKELYTQWVLAPALEKRDRLELDRVKDPLRLNTLWSSFFTHFFSETWFLYDNLKSADMFHEFIKTLDNKDMHQYWFGTYERLFAHKDAAIEAVNAGAMSMLIHHAKTSITGHLPHESPTSRIIEALLQHDESVIAFVAHPNFDRDFRSILSSALGPTYTIQIITRLASVADAWERVSEHDRKKAFKKLAKLETKSHKHIETIYAYSKKQTTNLGPKWLITHSTFPQVSAALLLAVPTSMVGWFYVGMRSKLFAVSKLRFLFAWGLGTTASCVMSAVLAGTRASTFDRLGWTSPYLPELMRGVLFAGTMMVYPVVASVGLYRVPFSYLPSVPAYILTVPLFRSV